MSARSSIQVGQNTYVLWLRVDCDDKKGFPDELLDKLNNLTKHPQTARHIRSVKDTRLIVDATLFELIQADIDLLPKCRVSLVAVDTDTNETKAIIMNAKTYGKSLEEYDQIKRYLYY